MNIWHIPLTSLTADMANQSQHSLPLSACIGPQNPFQHFASGSHQQSPVTAPKRSPVCLLWVEERAQALETGHAVFEPRYQMDSLSLFAMSYIDNPTHFARS